MEKIEFRINFKKYREHCKKNGIQIPRWMNHIIFNEVVTFMERSEKLQACKYLTTLSKENKTRRPSIGESYEGESYEYDGYDFGLKWSKIEVADVIELYRVITHYEAPAPAQSLQDVSINTIKDAIAPFAEIGERYFQPRQLVPNQVTVRVNTSDLKAILQLHNTLKQYGEL